MVSTSTDELSIKTLADPKYKAARKADKFKDAELDTELLSVSQYDCDAGAAILFHNKEVIVSDPGDATVTIPGKVLLRGKLKPNGLYMVNINDNNGTNATQDCPYPQFKGLGCNADEHRIHRANALTIRTVPALINYYHLCLGAPPIRSWLNAIDKGWFSSWPGLTADKVRKYCSDKPQTTYGHMQLQRQHVDSTKTDADYEYVPELENPPHNNNSPRRPRSKRHRIEAYLIDDLKNMIAIDTTGRYPITSNRGHNYVFVLLDTDTNHLYYQPMKSRKSTDMVEAYKACYRQLTKQGFTGQLVRLDNEVSAELIAAFDSDKHLDYQLVPPNDHRNNPCELAIKHAKAHLIAVRACTDATFDPKDWDLLLPHCEHTINLLRTSKINPLVSAYTITNGHYDFRRNPIAPAGTRIIVHETKLQRGTWGDKGIDGYFLGMAPKHYRTVRCYIPSTRGLRHSNTVEYFPECCDVPRIAPLDYIGLCIDQLRSAICDSRPNDLFHGSTTLFLAAMRELEALLGIPRHTSKGDKPSKGEKPTQDEARNFASSRPPRFTHPTSSSTTNVTIYPNGTIIRKRFGNEWFEGTIVGYDHKQQYYKISYVDGDAEEMTHDEAKLYWKPVQQYSTKSQRMILDLERGNRAMTARQNYYSKLKGFQTNRYNTRRINEYRLKACQAKVKKGTALITQLQRLALKAGCIWDNDLKRWMDLEALLKHPDPAVRERWQRSSAKEIGNIFQGFGETKGKNVCYFIPKNDIPKGEKVTYPRTVVAYRPEKIDNPWRTRITAGGDRLDYEGETMVNSADYTCIKCHWNSVLSSPGYKYSTMDAGNMYLESKLPKPRYVQFKLSQIPVAIQTQYGLHSLVDNKGYVYARIDKAWYGLKEAGRIAGDDIRDHLASFGYNESKFSPGFFTHDTRPISFTLVVDDLGVKWKNLEDFEHLRDCLNLKYEMKVDMDAKQYVGIDLKWDYTNRTLDCSMDEYIESALQEFEHTLPKQSYHAPSRVTRPDYGARVQYVVDDKSRKLSEPEIKRIQKVIGKFLFLARAIDNTMLHALNEIACDVSTGTEKTLDAATHLLNYIACNPNPRLRYRASEMILHVDSDAAFQVRPKARSRAGGYLYLGNKDNNRFNAPVLVMGKVIKGVMDSAAEAEVAAIHMNAKEAVTIRQYLEDMIRSERRSDKLSDFESCACQGFWIHVAAK